MWVSMDVYKEVSREIGQQKLALQYSEPGGTEESCAGKMKTRKKRINAQKEGFMGVMTGHRDYLISKELRKAAADGSFECVLELLRRGADATRPDSKGRTALHFAATRGDSNLVRLLITYGASVNQRDCNGNTPLHLACCTHHFGVVTTLLTAGTDVNALDSRGVTPLHLALSRLRIARESDDEGGLPLSRKRDMMQIVDMIQSYLHLSNSKDETDELEELAGKLNLSETTEQVDEVQGLLETFTSLSIQRRQTSQDNKDKEKT